MIAERDADEALGDQTEPGDVDADFGAMLEEMTALIVHEEDIHVVNAPKGGSAGPDGWEGEEGNTESSHERIEELRVFLEKELGFDRFFSSYQYVKETKVLTILFLASFLAHFFQIISRFIVICELLLNLSPIWHEVFYLFTYVGYICG